MILACLKASLFQQSVLSSKASPMLPRSYLIHLIHGKQRVSSMGLLQSFLNDALAIESIVNKGDSHSHQEVVKWRMRDEWMDGQRHTVMV